MAVVTKIKSTMEVSTEVKGGNEWNLRWKFQLNESARKVVTEKKSLLQVKNEWYVWWEEVTGMTSTMEVAD